MPMPRETGGPEPGLGRVVVLAPAKINLGLEVLGKRPDGYHEIATILQALRLTDTVTLTPALRAGNRSARAAGRARSGTAGAEPGGPGGRARPAAPRAAPGGGDHAGEADSRSAPAWGAVPPTRRRCSSGSACSVAAGCLWSGWRSWGRRSARTFRSSSAAGPSWRRAGASGSRPAPPWPGRHLVVAHPNRPLSTASIYGRGKLGLTDEGPLSTIRSRGFPWDFWTSDLSSLRNDLEPAVVEAEPSVATILGELRKLGSAFVRVTGSGSAVFGVAPDARASRRVGRASRAGGLLGEEPSSGEGRMQHQAVTGWLAALGI